MASLRSTVSRFVALPLVFLAGLVSVRRVLRDKFLLGLFDASHDPIALDVVLTRTDGQQQVLPMIVRFITDQKMQFQLSPDNASRPTNFSPEDTENQLVLIKQ